MCDCKAIKEVLEYDGTISMICRWAQDFLGYQYTCLHCPAWMMVDVDGLTRYFSSIITNHMCVAALLHCVDVEKLPNVYGCAISPVSEPTNLVPSKALDSVSIPILISGAIDNQSQDDYSLWETSGVSSVDKSNQVISESICSVPILLYHTPPVHLGNLPCDRDKETASTALHISDKFICNLICIDNTNGVFRSWSIHWECGSIEWYFETTFISSDTAALF